MVTYAAKGVLRNLCKGTVEKFWPNIGAKLSLQTHMCYFES